MKVLMPAKCGSSPREKVGMVRSSTDDAPGNPSSRPRAVRSLVEYLYTGELEVTGASAWNVLAAAEFLRLGEAKKMCVGVLVDKLTAETALGAAEAAKLYRCEELEAKAEVFLGNIFGGPQS